MAGGRLCIQRCGMVLWLEGDCIYSGVEWYFGLREIVYKTAWNGIVVVGILYIQRYGKLLWLDGD